jgi:predicted acyltransferase
MGAERSEQARIVSLDQFRGYTVLGMFVVNFAGHFLVMPAILKHHNTYCSYADTIMPQFFFAVGFAYRLTLLRRLQTVGAGAAYGHAVRRNLALILLGAVLYHLDGAYKNWNELERLGFWGFLETAFQRELFQTLVHIGVTAFWIMPVIAASVPVRIGFACFSAGLHLALSYLFYYDWVMTRPGIDGGVLGFLTWTLPMLAGSFAYDIVAPPFSTPPPAKGWGAAIGRLLGLGLILMLLGYALACLNLVTPPNAPPAPATAGQTALPWPLVEPPFVPPTRPVDIWTMSQRAGSVSYQTFGAGFSLALYALFVWACEVGRLRLGVFTTLGSNALAGYIIHGMIDEAMKPFAPKDAPLWYVLVSLGLFLAICYLFLRYLERHRLFLRL